MLGERGLFLQLEVGGEGAQAVHLVADFALGGFGRLAQALVLRLHPFDEGGELGVEGIAGGCELLLGLDGHGARGEALGEGFRSLGEDLFESEFVPIE